MKNEGILHDTRPVSFFVHPQRQIDVFPARNKFFLEAAEAQKQIPAHGIKRQRQLRQRTAKPARLSPGDVAQNCVDSVTRFIRQALRIFTCLSKFFQINVIGPGAADIGLTKILVCACRMKCSDFFIRFKNAGHFQQHLRLHNQSVTGHINQNVARIVQRAHSTIEAAAASVITTVLDQPDTRIRDRQTSQIG